MKATRVILHAADFLAADHWEFLGEGMAGNEHWESAEAIFEAVDRGAHQAELLSNLLPHRRARIVRTHNRHACMLVREAAHLCKLAFCRDCRRWFVPWAFNAAGERIGGPEKPHE